MIEMDRECLNCRHYRDGKCDMWCENGEQWTSINKDEYVKVVHAKWEWFDAWEGDDTFNEWKMLRCSNCLETEGARENAKFCPNCGATMDLKD